MGWIFWWMWKNIIFATGRTRSWLIIRLQQNNATGTLNYLITDGFSIFLQLNASGRTLDAVQGKMKPHVNKDLMTVCLDRAVSFKKYLIKNLVIVWYEKKSYSRHRSGQVQLSYVYYYQIFSSAEQGARVVENWKISCNIVYKIICTLLPDDMGGIIFSASDFIMACVSVCLFYNSKKKFLTTFFFLIFPQLITRYVKM